MNIFDSFFFAVEFSVPLFKEWAHFAHIYKAINILDIEILIKNYSFNVIAYIIILLYAI